METTPFWKEKTLHELSPAEWESLCDGCGKCCLHKVEDEKTGEVFFTNVACKLLDGKSGKCTQYKNRRKFVPDCRILTANRVYKTKWLPATCAYRLIAEGGELEPWHPLISNNPNTVHTSGNSVKGKYIVSEDRVKNLKKHIVTWLE